MNSLKRAKSTLKKLQNIIIMGVAGFLTGFATIMWMSEGVYMDTLTPTLRAEMLNFQEIMESARHGDFVSLNGRTYYVEEATLASAVLIGPGPMSNRDQQRFLVRFSSPFASEDWARAASIARRGTEAWQTVATGYFLQ